MRTLVVAGGSLAAGPATALELGDLEVQSTLGQPLRASIAYALGPNEAIDESCVAVRSGGRGLPGLHNAGVRVAEGVIFITGRTPLAEPMLSADIVIDCRSSAHINRNYLFFIDPRGKPASTARPSTPAAVAAAPAARTPVPPTTSIAPGTRYQVRPGDSLSRIVQRLDKSNVSSGAAMAGIFDANRGAFINGDPDRLKAGSWLAIPAFAGELPAAAAAATPPGHSAPVTRTTAGSTPYRGAETLAPDAARRSPATEPLSGVPAAAVAETTQATPQATEAGPEEPAVAGPASSAADYAAAYANLVAGDVIVDQGASADAPPVEPAAAPARVVDPAAGTRIVGSPQPAGSSWNWLIWIAVAVISAFGAYLMVWPKLRERFGSRPVDVVVPEARQAEHAAPVTLPESEITVEEIKATYGNVDFDLSDDSPTEESLALDADLVDGTGLDGSEEVDAESDFAFAATMDVDMELRGTPSARDSESETEVIPPPERPREDLVVSSEVLPDDDDDEYDISMVVDATKMPDPAEVTERDLMAVPVDDTGRTPVNDDYTIVDEIGQDILEQDYEDELSGTQLLNAEIEKAASELARDLGEGDARATDVDRSGPIAGPDGDTSIEMRLTNLSELDLTATLEAQNDDLLDEAEMTAGIEAEDKTVEMPREKDGARAR